MTAQRTNIASPCVDMMSFVCECVRMKVYIVSNLALFSCAVLNVPIFFKFDWEIVEKLFLFESNWSFVTLWPLLVAFCFLFRSVVETKTHLSEKPSSWLNFGDSAFIVERVNIKFQSKNILFFEIWSSLGSEYSIVKLHNTCFKHKLHHPRRTFGSQDLSKSPNKQVLSFSQVVVVTLS